MTARRSALRQRKDRRRNAAKVRRTRRTDIRLRRPIR